MTMSDIAYATPTPEEDRIYEEAFAARYNACRAEGIDRQHSGIQAHEAAEQAVATLRAAPEAKTLTCGALVATLTSVNPRLGAPPSVRVRISGPATAWERVLPADVAEAYARKQIGFELVRDSAHTAGLAFALKVKTPRHGRYWGHGLAGKAAS